LAIDSDWRWRLVRKLRNRPIAEQAQAQSLLSLRQAEAKDMYQVCEIYNFYIKNSVVTFDEEVMVSAQWEDKLQYLNGLGLPFIVAETSNSEILGFAYVAPWRQKSAFKRTVEDSIYLRAAATGKRLGTKLLERLIEDSRAAGVKEIVAVISDSGAESSIKLHEQFGFKTQGHLGKVGFKFGRWLGTVLMQKSL
jgi:L-amino acid N-acyltransferase YncA